MTNEFARSSSSVSPSYGGPDAASKRRHIEEREGARTGGNLRGQSFQERACKMQRWVVVRGDHRGAGLSFLRGLEALLLLPLRGLFIRPPRRLVQQIHQPAGHARVVVAMRGGGAP